MAKEDTLFMSYLEPDILVNYAANLIRWNAVKALEWMDEAKAHIMGNPFQIKAWNRAADSINNYIISVSKMRYFKEQDFWTLKNWKGEAIDNAIVPRFLEKINIIMSPEDYFAMHSQSRVEID
jgi:hypothetical protein